MTTTTVSLSPLGKEVSYPTHYDASVLFPIERAPNRSELTIPSSWYGADIWYAYEISWLNTKGKPLVAIGRFAIPWNSPFLIESKSLKLYLNSFNETCFDTIEQVQTRIQKDLSAVAGTTIEVTLYTLETYQGPRTVSLEGELIDQLDITAEHYEPSPHLLQCAPEANTVNETLLSHLLKSNCPVTGQPDWATVQISYTGKAIDKAALLRYIISFRRHTEFHEHCVERMYHDVMKQCQPERLFIMARYTRRGGLDINPWRSSHPMDVPDLRTERQ